MQRDLETILGRVAVETTISNAFRTYNSGLADALQTIHRNQDWTELGNLVDDIDTDVPAFTGAMLANTPGLPLSPLFTSYTHGIAVNLRGCLDRRDWGSVALLIASLETCTPAFCLTLASTEAQTAGAAN